MGSDNAGHWHPERDPRLAEKSDRRRTVLWFDADPAPEALSYAAAFAVALWGSGNATLLVCSTPHGHSLAEGVGAALDDAEGGGIGRPGVPPRVVTVDFGLDAEVALEALHATVAHAQVDVLVLVYPRELCGLLACNLDTLSRLGFAFKPRQVLGVTRH
jgi:hypothetical protein